MFVWAQCSDALILTYKLLPMALVAHFSLYWTDTISAAWHSRHAQQDLWKKQTPAAVGAFGHLCHLVLLAPSLAHTILFLKD